MKVPFVNRSEEGSYQRVLGEIFFDHLPKCFLLEQDLPCAVRRVCSAMVRIQGRNAQGRTQQGMGLALGGTVLTALHVVTDVEEFHLMHNGENIGARQIARDENFDLALLKSEKLLPAADSILSEETGLGYDELYALGYLWVKEAGEEKSKYKERLCAHKIEGIETRRIVKGGRFVVVIPSAVRDFMPGFSGGALVDSSGTIRGITQGVVKQPGWHLGMITITRNTYLWGAHSSAIRDFLEKTSTEKKI